MKKTLAIILFTLLIFTSCKKESRNCPAEDVTYTFFNKSLVDTSTTPFDIFIATRKEGSSLVFQYNYSYTSCPEIADGDRSEQLIFQIEPTKSNFKYYSDSLRNINCYYRSFCYGCPPSSIIPTGGIIEGRKINDKTWNINIDIKVNEYHSLKVEENFTLNK